MKQKIQIIHCSPNRCDNCSEQNGSVCQKLVTGMRELSESVILVERQRGLVHISDRVNIIPTEPPWNSDGWESIFIGPDNKLFKDFDNLIDIYPTGPYFSLFFKNSTKYHIRCEHIPIVRTSLELSLLDRLANESKRFIEPITTIRKPIAKQLEEIEKNISDYIQEQIPEINDITKLRLSQIASHRTNILGPLFPILLDEMTEEIYLDGPETEIYFDHQRMGRCITSITYTNLDIPRIITFIRFESNLHLDRSNPSLKMNLNIFDTNLRVSVSVPPLSVDGLHLEIRRARNNPYLIQNLIENDTLTYNAAALLLLAVACRFNITITGGPGTGKTTILNALDMATPRLWRKVYIEDAVESRLLHNHHQVRLQVDPVDEQQRRLNKSEEIVKCLHRSPDYLILGEIQTEDHSKALFQAMAAGLHSMQTCHSDTAESLVSRWIMNHGIERSSLGLMDLIVTLERPIPGESTRHVREIVEIRKGVQEGVLVFLGINKVYDYVTNTTANWSDNGAFLTHAKSHGINDPEKALNSLIEIFQRNEKGFDFERLTETLWSHGHPMKFI